MREALLTTQSMISAYSRTHSLHLPLSFIAEQLFKFAASAQWDLGDDTSLINLYSPQKLHQQREDPVSIEDIQTLLFGIHTAASVEAMSFARDLDADWPSFASIVKGAAGANRAFEMLLKDTGTEQAPRIFASKTLTALVKNMVSALLSTIHRND